MRCYSTHHPMSDTVFSPGIENATTKALADAGNGAPYYGRFGNGRVEGFFDGARDLELPEMAVT